MDINSLDLHLLSHKLQSLNTLATVGITWWVSSVVFCGSILSAAWIKRDDIAHASFFRWLRFTLGFFFISIVVFGIWLAILIYGIEIESQVLIKKLSNQQADFSWLSLGIIVGVSIGTTSFVIITVMWFKLWSTIEKEHKIIQTLTVDSFEPHKQIEEE